MPINLLQRTINTDPNNEIIPGNLLVGGTLGVTGATTLSSTLAVTGATTLSSTLAAGNTTITGTLSTTLAATLAALLVTGNASIGGVLSVTGDVTFLSTLAAGNTTITGTLSATSTATASTIYETQAVTTVTQSAYVVLPTDRLILLVSTGAGGPFAITFPVATQRIRVSIVMTAFNTATFTASVLGSTVIWENAGDAATFVNAGGGTWYLDGAPLSLTV